MSCFQQLFKARTSSFRAISPSNCTKNHKIIYFRALSAHKTHQNRTVQRAKPPRPVFTEPSSNLLHQTNNSEARTSGFRALSTHPTHPNPHSPACEATAAGFHCTIVQSSRTQSNNGEAKTAGFRALSTHKTHQNPHNPAGVATAAKSPRNPRRTAQLSC